jgi:hypothetical protein
MGNPAEKNDPQPESENIVIENADKGQQKFRFAQKFCDRCKKTRRFWRRKRLRNQGGAHRIRATLDPFVQFCIKE